MINIPDNQNGPISSWSNEEVATSLIAISMYRSGSEAALLQEAASRIPTLARSVCLFLSGACALAVVLIAFKAAGA